MPQLHRGATRHPKVAALSDRAFRVWVSSIEYCDDLLTDGTILKAAIGSLSVRPRPRDIAELTRILPSYTAGLWEERPDRFVLHDYLDWQSSKAQVQQSRARLRDRVRRHRERQVPGAGNAVGNAVTNGDVTKGTLTTDHWPLTDVPPNPPHAGGLNGARRVTRAERKRTDEIRRAVGPGYEDDGWFEECQRLHGGTCNGAGGHRLKMRIEAEKVAATA
jgi:hypothetical protein